MAGSVGYAQPTGRVETPGGQGTKGRGEKDALMLSTVRGRLRTADATPSLATSPKRRGARASLSRRYAPTRQRVGPGLFGPNTGHWRGVRHLRHDQVAVFIIVRVVPIGPDRRAGAGLRGVTTGAQGGDHDRDDGQGHSRKAGRFHVEGVTETPAELTDWSELVNAAGWLDWQRGASPFLGSGEGRSGGVYLEDSRRTFFVTPLLPDRLRPLPLARRSSRSRPSNCGNREKVCFFLPSQRQPRKP